MPLRQISCLIWAGLACLPACLVCMLLHMPCDGVVGIPYAQHHAKLPHTPLSQVVMCGPSSLEVPGSQTTPKRHPQTDQHSTAASTAKSLSLGHLLLVLLLALKPASGGTRPSFRTPSEGGAAARQRGEGSCTAFQPSPAAAARHQGTPTAAPATMSQAQVTPEEAYYVVLRTVVAGNQANWVSSALAG